MSSQTTRLGLVRRGIALSLLMAPVLAAPPIPDAGRLLRDIERSTGKRDLAPAPRLPPEQPVPAAPLPEPSGESVFVKSFNIRPAQPPEAPADSPPPAAPQTTPVVPTPPKKFPDAGRQPFLLPMNRPVPAMQLPERPGQAVFVESFNIHSTRFSQHELRTLLKGYSGRALTLNEFQEATRKIDEYYRQHDTPGHAYLPPQVVRQGVVDMLVVEGRLAQASATPIPRRDAKPVATLAESSAPPEPPRPAALDEKALQALIKDYAGRALTLNELQEAARKISDYYRQHDYLAHAYLPPQTVRDGVVEIVVVEGRLGQVRVDPASPTRMNQPLVTGIIERRVPPGQPLRPAALDEAVAVLNEVPGVQRASSTLAAGAKAGESDAILKVEDKPLMSSSLTLDNAGSHGTGEKQAMLSASLESPFGRGERFSVTGLKSQGSSYGRLEALMPVGYSGLTLGVNGSVLEYRVIEGFEALDLGGDSWTAGLTASYPLRRRGNLSLTTTAGATYKHLRDWAADVNLSDKVIGVGYLGLSASGQDTLWGGGVNDVSLTGTLGSVDLGGNLDKFLADRATAKTDGGYAKLSVSASREQKLSEAVTLLTRLQGQVAYTNLDGSEQFSLGGKDGVRAYPTGEANGDDGWLWTLEGRWQLAPGLQLTGFYDVGGVHLHNHPWEGWQTAGQPNDYVLQGAGVGVSWSPTAYFQIKAALAHVIGNNPGQVAGHNSDGTDDKMRAWVQTALSF